jgi:hypothetical protein
MHLQHLDPSVRDLAHVLLNHLGGIEQRVEQKFATLEHRQAVALESIVTHLNMNSKDKPVGGTWS